MIWQKQDKIKAYQEGRVEYEMDFWALGNLVSGVSTRPFKNILSHYKSKFFTKKKNMFPVFVWVNVSHFRLCSVLPSSFKSVYGYVCAVLEEIYACWVLPGMENQFLPPQPLLVAGCDFQAREWSGVQDSKLHLFLKRFRCQESG